MTRALLAIPVVLVLLTSAGCVGDVYAFTQRADTLRQEWKDMQAAGVPQARLGPLEHQLAAMEGQRLGPLPYALTSGALVHDPMGNLDRQTKALYERVTAESRSRARAALQHLRDDYGPTSFDYPGELRRLDAARKPADYQRLARGWTADATQLDNVKGELASKSGSLNQGLPADVVSGRDQLQAVLTKTQQAQLWTEPADQALTAAKQYLASSYQSMLAQHDAVAGQVQQANDTLNHRLDLHTQGSNLVQTAPGLLQYASGDESGQVSQGKNDFAAARDDSQLEAAVNELQDVVNSLWQKKQLALQRLAAGSGGCVSGMTGKTILISLSAQRLVACDGSTAFLSSLVTTGKPGLETPTGLYQIIGKWATWHMVSQCAKGTPCYYDPAWVSDAMEFRSDGYFLHSWPQPQYGPGTQYQAYASHGCVHVPMDALNQLFNWAEVGTAVVITS
jgi:hypothetical protein